MKKRILFIVFTLFIYISCKNQKKIEIDSSNVVGITPDLEWAVVQLPYVAFRKDADFSSEVTFHARKGDIFLVKGKKNISFFIESENPKDKPTLKTSCWYYFSEGWLEENNIAIYDTKLKALEVSKKILKTE